MHVLHHSLPIHTLKQTSTTHSTSSITQYCLTSVLWSRYGTLNIIARNFPTPVKLNTSRSESCQRLSCERLMSHTQNGQSIRNFLLDWYLRRQDSKVVKANHSLSYESSHSKPPNSSKVTHLSRISQHPCTYCGEPYIIVACQNFKRLNEQERRKFVMEKPLCFNRLGLHSANTIPITILMQNLQWQSSYDDSCATKHCKQSSMHSSNQLNLTIGKRRNQLVSTRSNSTYKLSFLSNAIGNCIGMVWLIGDISSTQNTHWLRLRSLIYLHEHGRFTQTSTATLIYTNSWSSRHAFNSYSRKSSNRLTAHPEKYQSSVLYSHYTPSLINFSIRASEQLKWNHTW